MSGEFGGFGGLTLISGNGGMGGMGDAESLTVRRSTSSSMRPS